MSKLRLSAVLILLILILATATGCERVAPFQIKNDTTQTLSVFIDDVPEGALTGNATLTGKVKPGEVIKPKYFLRESPSFLIEAKDSAGNVVYSRVFTKQELEDMNWEVVITQSQ